MLILCFKEIIKSKIEKEAMLFVKIWCFSYLILLNKCMSVAKKGIKRKSMLLNFKLLLSSLWEERKLQNNKLQSGWNIMLMEVMNGVFQSLDQRKKYQLILNKIMLFQTSQWTITILVIFFTLFSKNFINKSNSMIHNLLHRNYLFHL